MQLATLKQREEKAERRAGRVAAGTVTHRLVPLSDAQYVTQLEMMTATLRIPLERRSEKTGRMEKVRLWEITDQTARTWLNEALQSLLGHKSAKSTEIYTRVFALDVAARHRVQFQMPGNDAVDLLKSVKAD